MRAFGQAPVADAGLISSKHRKPVNPRVRRFCHLRVGPLGAPGRWLVVDVGVGMQRRLRLGSALPAEDDEEHSQNEDAADDQKVVTEHLEQAHRWSHLRAT